MEYLWKCYLNSNVIIIPLSYKKRDFPLDVTYIIIFLLFWCVMLLFLFRIGKKGFYSEFFIQSMLKVRCSSSFVGIIHILLLSKYIAL